MSKLLINNGLIVNADKSAIGNIFIDNGLIQTISESSIIVPAETQIIDANGFMILPGGVDPHVHFDLPTPAGNSCDDFYSGSRAAIAGGTTTIIDFVTPYRGQPLLEALELRKRVSANCLADYSFHMGITWWNPSLEHEIRQCIEIEGITSFKTYLAYKNSIGISYDELKHVMEVVARYGGTVTVHAEDGDQIDLNRKHFLDKGKTSPLYHALSRPPKTESDAVMRVIELSELTGCKTYFVHISTKDSVKAIQTAQKKGLPIYAETCVQYLLLDESVYTDDFYKSAPYVISPPIRSQDDRDALWEGLANGVFVAIATDHCPFNLFGQKDTGIGDFSKIPNGAGGVEHRIGLMYTYGVMNHKITINQLVNLISTSPANTFSLPGKGRIAEGFDADLAIWDFKPISTISVRNHFSLCDSEIYEGLVQYGKPVLMIKKGTSIVPDITSFIEAGNQLIRSAP
jgi:dihydropyrimidinase